MNQLFRFAVVGTIGFVVDTAVLYAMLALSLDHVTGRLISFACAVYTTWAINRRITFTPSATSLWREFGRYFLAMSGGGLVNLVAYNVAIAMLPNTLTAPAISVGIGSLAGLTVNFAAAKFWVYR